MDKMCLYCREMSENLTEDACPECYKLVKKGLIIPIKKEQKIESVDWTDAIETLERPDFVEYWASLHPPQWKIWIKNVKNYFFG